MVQYIIFLPLVVLVALFAANITKKGFHLLTAIISVVLGIAFGIYLYFKMNFYGNLNEITYISICSVSIFCLAYISILPLVRKS